MTEDTTVRLVGYVTPAERERIQRAATLQDRSVASWLRKAIRAQLEREEGGNGDD